MTDVEIVYVHEGTPGVPGPPPTPAQIEEAVTKPAVLDLYRWNRPSRIGTGADLNAFTTAGSFQTDTSAAVPSTVNLPAGVTGHFELTVVPSGFGNGVARQDLVQYAPAGQVPRSWTRFRWAGTWQAWVETTPIVSTERQTVKFWKAALLSTSDVNALPVGEYSIGSPQIALDLGMPATQPGFLSVRSILGDTPSSTAGQVQVYTALYGDGTARMWRRSRYQGGVFTPWVLEGSGGGGSPIDVNERLQFTQRSRFDPPSGPAVILRFDDGHKNNLEVAAPILAEHGFRGTLYTGTHPTEWLGTTQNGGLILTASELVMLHDEFGWEIGSHTRRHDRWDHATGTGGAGAEWWWRQVRDGIKDFAAIGLPRPRSFAYPNGQRAKQADRMLYRDFEHIGMIGEPEMVPMRFDEPNLFTGWQELVVSTTDNLTRSMERIKRNITAALGRGQNVVLAFHGTQAGGPPASHSWWQDEQSLRALMAWVAGLGVRVITQQETRTHNLLGDPSFWDEAPHAAGGRFSSFPWKVDSDVGWQRVERPTVGGYHMVLNTGGLVDNASRLSQTIPVKPGETYHLYWDVTMPSRTAGRIEASVTHKSPRVDVSSTGVVSQVTLSTTPVGTQDVTTTGYVTKHVTFTVPSDPEARVAEIAFTAVGFQGEAGIGFASAFPTSYIDPLA